MKRISSWGGLRMKLLALAATILVLTVVVAAIGISGLGSANSRATDIYDNGAVAIQHIGEMRNALTDTQRGVVHQLLVRDRKVAAEEVGRRRASERTLDAELRGLSSTRLTRSQRADVARVSPALKRYRGDRDRVLALDAAGQHAAALRELSVGREQELAVTALLERLSRSIVDSTAAKDHAVADAYRSDRTLMIGVTVLAVLLGAGLATIITRGILRGVGAVLRAARGIADGELEQALDVRSSDEIGTMAAAMRTMIAYLRDMAESARRIAARDLTVEVQPKSERDELGTAFVEMVDGLRATVGQLSATTTTVSGAAQQMASTSQEAGRAVEEIANAVGEVAAGAQRQVDDVETARGLMGEVVVATGRSSEDAAATVTAAEDARRIAAEGTAAVAEATEAMASVRTASDDATGAISSLGSKSEEIGGIVNVITAIAEQTNLLALNAAIEAARAGEQGRGFAVVAEEVRKLAEESQRAAQSIAALIAEIQAETGHAVEVVALGATRIEQGTTTVERAREAFERIDGSIEDVTSRIGLIATAIEQIAGSAQTMGERIGEVASVAEQSSASTEQVSASTEQTSASAQQIAASAEELAASAVDLERLVATFRVEMR